MYVCTKTEDSTLVGRAVLLLAVWRGLVSRGGSFVELRVTLGRTTSMPAPDAAARHTGAGVA